MSNRNPRSPRLRDDRNSFPACQSIGLIWFLVTLTALLANSTLRVHHMTAFPEEETGQADGTAPLVDFPQAVLNLSQVTPKRFAFVHLGKCGGVSLMETLHGYLGRKTLVGRAFAGSKRYHLSKPEVDEYENWILAIRDPVGRIRSWWTYDHNDNFLYRTDSMGFQYRSKMWPKLFECYPTLDNFTTYGLAPTKTIPDECQTLAQMAIPLRESSLLVAFQHLRFNFHAYFTPLLAAEDKSLYVVRTEHMLDDLNSISFELGDDGYRLPGVVHQSHWRSEDYPNKDRYISEKGMENLCHHLCNEIQIYKEILKRGLNIGNKAREASLRQLSKSCPLQVASDECPLGMSEDEWDTLVKHFRPIAGKDAGQVFADREAIYEKRRNPPPPMKKHKKVQLLYQADQDEASYGFLHLGRCGGQTVRSLLESHKGTTLYRKNVNGTWTSRRLPLYWKHKHWVVLTRDPLDRLLSWWTYHHPSNLAMRPDRREQEEKPQHLRADLKKFYECYPTFPDLVSDGFGGVGKHDDEAAECRRIAGRSFTITEIPSLHDVDYAYSYYQHEFKVLSSELFVFVIRAEFMSTDMNGIEAMLNREQSNVFSRQEANTLRQMSSTESWPVTADLSQLDVKGMDILCRRMCSHIQMYKYFLREAINLARDAYETSMKQLVHKCPLQVKEDECK